MTARAGATKPLRLSAPADGRPLGYVEWGSGVSGTGRLMWPVGVCLGRQPFRIPTQQMNVDLVAGGEMAVVGG